MVADEEIPMIEGGGGEAYQELLLARRWLRISPQLETAIGLASCWFALFCISVVALCVLGDTH